MDTPAPVLELHGLLAERNTHRDPAVIQALDRRIRARFERPLAVLISDMAGFSTITQKAGIIHFLALIQRMQGICVPLIKAHGGHLIKEEADNLYAIFEQPVMAVEAAVAMRAACAEDAQTQNDLGQVQVAIGLGFGPILDIDGHDFFGDQVNMASKLGEDIASSGQILLTRKLAEQLSGHPLSTKLSTHSAQISNVELDYLSLGDFE
ncbi:MAG: adenylate cyclase [Cognaticolwellia sp.]|jgi:adenylate cyclase